MNPFYNPIFLSKMLKSYIFDIDRLRKTDEKELKRYRDKRFKWMIKQAYNTPIYHDKYRAEKVDLDDIKGLDDIQKLPIISKDDLKKYYPKGIKPQYSDKKKLVKISTSGTTGKSLTIYVDIHDIIIGLFGYIRMLREYGISWRKNKLTIIGDFAPHTVETGYITKGLFTYLQTNHFFKNMQWLNTNNDPLHIIKEIERFKPDFIGGYVGMLGHLAVLKEKGYGKNIKPQYIAATGSVLDPDLKKFIEENFDTHVFETYGAAEAGPIAFQCKKGKYHIMSDFIHIEFIKNKKHILHEEPGHIVITKLYGNGTPIIRYSGVNDIAAPLHGRCSCGLSGNLIKKIYGRDDLSLHLPDGKTMLSSSISQIFSKILYQLKTNKIKNIKIFQHNLTKIEIQVEIDKKLRNIGPNVNEILSTIKHGFQKKVGSKVEILVREVKQVDQQGPRIISMVDKNRFKTIQYI